MNEKDIVLDILENLKANAHFYSRAILDCSDIGLREKLKKMRIGIDDMIANLTKIATEKSYLIPHLEATDYEKQNLKATLTNALTNKNGAGPVPVIK